MKSNSNKKDLVGKVFVALFVLGVIGFSIWDGYIEPRRKGQESLMDQCESEAIDRGASDYTFDGKCLIVIDGVLQMVEVDL